MLPREPRVDRVIGWTCAAGCGGDLGSREARAVAPSPVGVGEISVSAQHRAAAIRRGAFGVVLRLVEPAGVVREPAEAA